MISFAFADSKHCSQLYLLWRECFCEERVFTDLFFEKLYPKAECVAAFDGETLCAALYLIPAKLNVRGELKDAAYVYGAATFPQYRNRGIMRGLLDFTSLKIAESDIDYLFLMPAGEELFDFYEKCGYKRCFKIRTVIKEKEEIPAKYNCIKRRNLSENIDNIYNLRFNSICKNAGSVIRFPGQLEYALELIRKEKGGIFCDKNGYLLYRVFDSCTEIVEACGDYQSFLTLFPLMAEKTQSKRFKLNLPVMSDIFPNEGEIHSNGMLRAINGDYDLGNIFPYMGINFD